MDNYIFEKCAEINNLLNENYSQELEARNQLIKLLDYHKKNNIQRSELVNHLIRQTGLYPYLCENPSDDMVIENIHWQDRFVYEAFKVDTGGKDVTLHREQSNILKQLLSGENLAVSAPTSFGKSFIIDAFISLKKPDNVVIIVPTIALMDETRRRLCKKFSNRYKIITTAEATLSEKNILIFPQERALSYIDLLQNIDMLIVDEFYKASSVFDKERSPALINTIMKLGGKAKQKYFLAPNISKISDGFLTSDLKPVIVNFNTVFLEVLEYFSDINGDKSIKNSVMIDILQRETGKSIIYAGTYKGIEEVCSVIENNLHSNTNKIISDFRNWLEKNYSNNWYFLNVLNKNLGIHNGQLHRPLSQIQMKLFEDQHGLQSLVTTSSIIEGINTSAENVIIWSNKNGNPKLDFFSYKNLQGRAGRMFKHFIGKVYVLEKPPNSQNTQLVIDFPDQLMGAVDIDNLEDDHLFTPEQIASVIQYKEDMKLLLGDIGYDELRNNGLLRTGDSQVIYSVAKEIKENPVKWKDLIYLNSDSPTEWESYLYKILPLGKGGWGTSYTNFVLFIQTLSKNWEYSIPKLLSNLSTYDIGIEEFFKFERSITFKLTSLLNDINVLQKIILKSNTDIAPFITKLSNAFLPPLVYQLEEYGLPRMLSRKIHQSNIIDLERTDIEISVLLNEFLELSDRNDSVIEMIFDDFDKYLYKHFIDGITYNVSE